MYYIYHIIERKEWGCTNNLKRRLCQLKYKAEQVDKVLTCDDINEAAELEKKMNIEYGYQWNNSQYYTRVLKMHSNENRIKGGSIGGLVGGPKSGQIAKETGQIYELSKKSSMRVTSINVHTNERMIHDSLHSAARYFDGCASKISQVCRGRRKTHMKHKFEYIK
jgi:hypothetical protein